MAFDLQMVQAQTYVPITSVKEERLDDVLMVAITGGPFVAVEQVLINGQESPSIFLEHDKLLLAQVPDSELGTALSVEVLSPAIFQSDYARFRFLLGRQPKLITGFPRLIQTFVRALLQTPGTSLINPTVGGGLLSLVRSALPAGQTQAIAGAAHLSVQKTANDLVGIQARSSELARVEKLATAELLACGMEQDRLYMDIRLTNQAGQSAKTSLQS